MTELILKGGKMATQKKLKLVILIIISASMATNIQAGLIEPIITTTRVSQSPYQIPQTPDLFVTAGEDFAFLFDSIQYSAISRQQNQRYGVIPWAFRAFGYGMNRDWNLLQLYPYGVTMSALSPLKAQISANEVLLYIPFTESSLWENRYLYPYDFSYYPYAYGFSYYPYTYNLLYYPNLYYPNVFFENNEASGQFVVTSGPGERIFPVAVPEPATLVLLSFGTLIFVGKGR